MCSVLADCWDLPVVCDCITSDNDVCDGACMGRRLRLLVLTLHIGEHLICYSTPFSLSNDWTLSEELMGHDSL